MTDDEQAAERIWHALEHWSGEHITSDHIPGAPFSFSLTALGGGLSVRIRCPLLGMAWLAKCQRAAFVMATSHAFSIARRHAAMIVQKTLEKL